MRGLILSLTVALLTFALGLICVWVYFTYVAAEDMPQPEPVNFVPLDTVASLPEQPRTPDDFEEFWTAFKAAVQSEDEEQLFVLTSHSYFHWEQESLKCSHHDPDGYFRPQGYHCAFRTQAEFKQNYKRIFTDVIKRKVLTENPYPGAGGYEVIWDDSSGSYSLLFLHAENVGYKFFGLLVGPAPPSPRRDSSSRLSR